MSNVAEFGQHKRKNPTSPAGWASRHHGDLSHSWLTNDQIPIIKEAFPQNRRHLGGQNLFKVAAECWKRLWLGHSSHAFGAQPKRWRCFGHMSLLKNPKIWRVEHSKSVEGDGRQPQRKCELFLFFLSQAGAENLLWFRGKTWVKTVPYLNYFSWVDSTLQEEEVHHHWHPAETHTRN